MKTAIKKILLRIKHKNKSVFFDAKSNIAFRSCFEGHNCIGKRTCFSGSMGYGSYIGTNCNISAEIGRYCSIGNGVKVVNGFHPTSSCVSTHPAFYSSHNCVNLMFSYSNSFREQRYAVPETKRAIMLGHDVWIGDGAIILAGLTIGSGAIIGAGAVVTKNVAPYAIVGGVPAKVIRYRFKQEQIEKLLRIEWWNWSDTHLKKIAEQFSDVQQFLATFD